jgi:ATP:ADP antiporter, AAA family
MKKTPKLLLPLLIIFFLLSFCYNALRDLKDSLIITQELSNAEVIPFIKIWAVLPMAILLIYIFTQLSRKISFDKIFYIITSAFLIYFLIFVFLIYPQRDILTLHNTANHLQKVLPMGLSGFISMVRYWHFSLFYVMAELWGNIVLSVLFWSFANKVTPLDDAKRFYTIFGLVANIAIMLAGRISLSLCCCEYIPSFYGTNAWEQTIVIIVCLVTACGIAAMIIYHRTTKKIQATPRDDKITMTLSDSFQCIFQSRYVFFLAFIVFTYNMIINLVEVVWKNHVMALYPLSSDFTAYMSKVTMWSGLAAIIIAILFSGNTLKRVGWTKTALTTPIILLLTSILMFAAMAFSGNLSIIVLFGAIQNGMSRATKYTIFDATKEMAFIPLDRFTRIKAKASIDGACSRLGKSTSAIIYQVLLVTFSSLSACLVYISGMVFILLGGWLYAASSLGMLFNKKNRSTR